MYIFSLPNLVLETEVSIKTKVAIFSIFLCLAIPVAFGAVSLLATRVHAAGAIKIGFIGSNTGLAADLGGTSTDGAKLFAKEVNQSGGIHGKKIDMIVYDEEGNPAKAKALARKLAEVGTVLAMISGTTSGCTLAMLKVSQEAKLPHVVCVVQSPM